MIEYIPLLASLILGIVIFTVGFFMYKKDKKIRTLGNKTIATVFDIKEESSNDGITYRPVLRFNHKGNTVEQELDYSTGFKPKKKVPYKEEIYYLEEKNKLKLILANNSFSKLFYYSFMVIGFLLIILFLYLLKTMFL